MFFRRLSDRTRGRPRSTPAIIAVDGNGVTLAGHVMVVTGASRGIGRAAALGLAASGAHIIAVARTIDALEELDDELQHAGGAATLVPLDLNDFAGIDGMAAALMERWGKLDGLFGNAGILGPVTPLT